MFANPIRALRWRALALASILCLTALAPVTAFAQDAPHTIGAAATVADSSPVLLRSTPGWDAAAITELAPGAGVTILNGPSWAADGSQWYEVSVWADGQTGWLPGYALISDSTAVTSKESIAVTTDPGVATEYEKDGSGNVVNGEPAVYDQPEAAALAAQATGSGYVVGTNGEGVRCRGTASYDGWVITVLPEGAWVELTGAAVGEWQPVNCAGQSGFVAAAFISVDAPSVADPLVDNVPSTEGTTAPAADTAVGAVSGYATVTGTNGEGVRCRADASYDASIITVLGEGTQVALNGGAVGEWQPVICGGATGYVHAAYLGGGGEAAPVASLETFDQPAPSTGDTVVDAASGTATITGTNGDGVRCRADASYDAAVITVLAEGSAVQLNGGAVGEWQPVICAGTSGYVHSSFVGAGEAAGTAPAPTDTATKDPSALAPPAASGATAGTSMVTTSDINLRYEPSSSAGVAAVAPAGTVVTVTGEPVNGYYPVNWDGLTGYMYGDYLSATDQAPSERGGSGTAGVDTVAPGVDAGPSAAGSSSGSGMVDFAMQYVGYPYVWAGEGPYGFDCSGFTMFVARNVLGLEITHDMAIQFSMGTPVGRGELQPGDLVFFQNTFQWGLSHVGIYIGGGQFVHAENESTGVTVSDLNSDYYSSRWYGAVRLA